MNSIPKGPGVNAQGLSISTEGMGQTSSNATTKERFEQVMNGVASTLMGALSAAAPFVPGGSVVSAALSGVEGAASQVGGSGGGGGFDAGGGGIGTSSFGGGSSGGGGILGGGGGIGGIGGGSSGGSMGSMQQMQQQMFNQNLQMVAFQNKVQQDNQKIQTISKIIEVKGEAESSVVNDIH